MPGKFASPQAPSYDPWMCRALVLVVLLASPVLAQKAPHKEGDYGGVSPGEVRRPDPSGKPARPRKLPPRGTLTWVGFEAKDGGAQVFLQSVAPFEVTQRVEGSTLIVHLTLTRLGTNTWRPVDTRFFDNPLARITARAARGSKGGKQRAGGIDVRIAFKSPKDVREASVRTGTEADGMYYVYLSFPEGAEPQGSPARPGADDVGE